MCIFYSKFRSIEEDDHQKLEQNKILGRRSTIDRMKYVILARMWNLISAWINKTFQQKLYYLNLFFFGKNYFDLIQTS